MLAAPQWKELDYESNTPSQIPQIDNVDYNIVFENSTIVLTIAIPFYTKNTWTIHTWWSMLNLHKLGLNQRKLDESPTFVNKIK